MSKLLKLAEIAAWQVPGVLPETVAKTPIRATLPALQRGSVWKPHQAEKLWDSLLRSFPVGAFMFAPYNRVYGNRGLRLERLDQAESDPPTHYLLDGQQRANAIALGFYNIWEKDSKGEYLKEREHGPVLWLDLGAAPDDEREYVPRLLTRSHPWGYQRKEPEKRLAAGHMRDALKSYKDVSPYYKQYKPAHFPLQYTWPWDAQAPIPLVFIVDAVRFGATDVAEAILKKMAELPFWDGQPKLQGGGNLRTNVRDYLESRNGRFDQVVNTMRVLLAEDSGYGVPILILPETTMTVEAPIENQKTEIQKPDAIETLFVRVNAGGTRLEGEELIYSLLKSAWTEAPQVIEKLQPDGHQLFTPTRMVTLITRLILAREQEKKRSKNDDHPPLTPNVTRFRGLIKDSNFFEKIKAFTDDQNTPKIFTTARHLLTLDNRQNDPYRLPLTLAAELTQGKAGADLMLLVLHWIDKMMRGGWDPLEKLSTQERKELLGFLTVLSWFSFDSGRCLRRLWPKLLGCEDYELPNFFNHIRFKSLIPRDPDTGLILIPVIPPKVLDEVIRDRVTNGTGTYGGFDKPNHIFWKEGQWEHYNNHLIMSDFPKLNSELQSWLKSLPTKVDGSTTEGEQDSNELLHLAWKQFIDHLWSEKRLLQYAQRDWLSQQFSDFDPTLPDQTEDINRPWDYDHIHPQYFVTGRRHIPSVVRSWHGSIGNLRAWPQELNKSDQHIPPGKKLARPIPSEKDYGINDEQELRSASFITENEWELWKNSVPLNNDESPNYLANSANHTYRKNLVHAITNRICRIYHEWYDTLCLGNLFNALLADRYKDNNNGTVTDVKTGLQWMRFSLGQEWENGTCNGDAMKYTWQEALNAAEVLNQRGYARQQNWRVPTKEELQTLIYSSSGLPSMWNDTGEPCQEPYRHPTIYQPAFPNTPSSWYWSSSDHADNSSRAMVVYFEDGSVRVNSKNSRNHIRLVRGGP